MKRALLLAPALAAGALLLGAGRTVTPAVTFSDEELRTIQSLTGLGTPAPSRTNAHAGDPDAVRLGQLLFFEERLSANGRVSCATCHDPAKDWSDGLRTAEGLGTGTRNTPSLWNVGHSEWHFWDGRADSLWSQALGPIENPAEMGGSRAAAWQLVASDPELRAAYERAFGALPEGHGADLDHFFANVGKAIAAFERRIVSTASRFDDFARGLRERDQSLVDRLSPAAQRGLKLFVGRGQCTLCHHGPGLTDGEFHNVGLGTPRDEDADVGRYDGVDLVKKSEFNGLGTFSDDTSERANMRLQFVVKKLNNMGEFKTPTLRNVAATAPYMHDGRFATLREVVTFYSKLDQEPAIGHREESLERLDLSDSEIADLVAFLESLTDESRQTTARLLLPERARKTRRDPITDGTPSVPATEGENR